MDQQTITKLQAEFFTAIADGVQGKERGDLQRKVTVALKKYNGNFEEVVEEAHKIAGTKMTDKGIVRA